MIAKLKEKGFCQSYGMGADVLEGTFNGVEVYVAPVMNGNKVRRVAVMYKNPLDEIQIKLHFNRLVDQFSNNGKYQAISEAQKIPENERISHQMTIYKKQYEAGFVQLPYNSNKIVTVLISEQRYDKYHILIFYDNGYNTANGEDL